MITISDRSRDKNRSCLICLEKENIRYIVKSKEFSGTAAHFYAASVIVISIEKARDTDKRKVLWTTLFKSGWSGKILSIIRWHYESMGLL